MTEPPHIETRASWRVLAASGVIVAFGVQSLWFATLGLFLKPLQQDLGWSRADIAFVITLLTFLVPALMPAIGWLVDRVALRPLILVSVVLQALGIAANSLLGGSVWNFYALVVGVAIVAAGASSMTLAKLIKGWFDASLGRAFGILFACASLGGIVNPLLAQALLQRLGWRQAYIALGAVALVLGGLAAWLAIRERPGAVSRPDAGKTAAQDAASSPGEPTSFASLLRVKSWWLLALWNCAFAFAVSGILFHFAPMLQDRGVTPADSAIALSLMAGSAFAGNLAIGWLMDRMPARFLACAMMIAPLCAVMMLLGSDDTRVALVAAMVFGLCSGSEGSLNAYLVGRLFGARMFGRAYSTQQVVIGLGGGFAPWMVALLQGRSGNYTLALMLSAGAFGLAAALALLLPNVPSARPAGREQPVPAGT